MADRLPLLKLLHRECVSAVIENAGVVQAYGFARRGFHASSIGPVVAADPDAGRNVVHALLSGLPDGNVYWDFMPDNVLCRSLAESLGFTIARKLMRMYLGQMNPGQVNIAYAGAGFELG